MARKKNIPSSKNRFSKSPAKVSAPVRTEVRNTAIPRITTPVAVAAPRKEITQEAIAKRAYEIFASGQGGSETDNWHRAERELRGA
jgi:hypothetical protein